LRRLDVPLAPLVLTLVLGPLMERSLRESLELSQGDFTVFVSRPTSAVLLVIAVLIAASPLLRLRKPAALTDDPEA
jgi:putative tricarboxylic transport membrane protein